MPNDNYKVVSVSPARIEIEVIDIDAFAGKDEELTIGSLLRISDASGVDLVASVQSFKVKDPLVSNGSEATKRSVVLELQPLGHINAEELFKRGGREITIPPSEVRIADKTLLKAIYGETTDRAFCFSSLHSALPTDVFVDGDRFFGKHLALVGATGSGKSCAVARILQEGISPSAGQSDKGVLNNSHILVFDLHGEYSSAFPTAVKLSVASLDLPYWLMNAEELEEFFLEGGGHNQLSTFRTAVVENKKRHNPTYANIAIDSPLYFDIQEVLHYLYNLNTEIIGRLAGEEKPKLKDSTLVDDRSSFYFQKRHEFVRPSTSKDEKATNGPFHGEFDRLIIRLESLTADPRLEFVLNKRRTLNTGDLLSILQQFSGYSPSKESNIVIVDLAGVPFEILSTVVSLITRLMFDCAYHYKKIKDASATEVPFLLVYEEAHNYIPKAENARYASVRKSIERVAKEGRKYGVTLMVVTQRPSEVSETIFSQCNNFVVMRVSNAVDQEFVKKLLPDNIQTLTGSLAMLEQREALLIGDSVAVPSRVQIKEVTDKPDSHDVRFHTEWRKDWYEAALGEVAVRMLPALKKQPDFQVAISEASKLQEASPEAVSNPTT